MLHMSRRTGVPCGGGPLNFHHGRATLAAAASEVHMGRRGTVLLGLLLVLLAPLAQAQWKWKDAAGQVHASDLPPPRGIPDKDVLARPEVNVVRRPPPPVAAASAASAPATGVVADARSRVEPELEAKRKKAEAEQAERARIEEDRQAAVRAENCQRAKSNLAALESGQRIARPNEKGEREMLDDRARAEEITRSRQQIAADCR
jgi:Domain of unknown function (DUF4124)